MQIRISISIYHMVYLVFTVTQLPAVSNIWIVHYFRFRGCKVKFITHFTRIHLLIQLIFYRYSNMPSLIISKKRSTGNSVCYFLALSFWTNSHAISTDQSRKKTVKIFAFGSFCVSFVQQSKRIKINYSWFVWCCCFFSERKRIRMAKTAHSVR